VSGAMSNTAQFWWSGEVFFGGMSGVVYALIGYLWIAGMIFPQPENQLPKGIVIFMIGWLVLCMTPVVTFFIGVGIANAAHLAGLVFGMMLGGVFGLVGKINQHRV
jgi:GlpG protein